MTDQEWTAECTTDVLVSLTESLHIFTGLLTVSTVCGVFSGLLASSLLYVFCLKPMLLTRQGYNARRLFEPEDAEVDNNNQSDCVSNSKKEVQSGTINVKDKKQQLPINSDVAAFASRAKVVYPINQKYRPLADGASNPSLHEHAKLPSMPNDESCSSSSGESLSQEQDNDDSSQFISSSLLPKSLQNQSFTRVSHYPHTLTQIGFEGRISLYCLALQDIQQHCSQLQEEKCQIFLQIMKIIFSHRFPKDKNYADFSTNILQMQEKELDELKKKVSTAQNSSDGNEDQQADAPCTLEEIERAQKDQLEQSLQMTKGFSRQVEALCKHLLDRRTSVVPTEEAQEIIHSLTHTLLLMENHLSDTQEADLKRTQQRLLWWEQLMGLLQSQPALLKQEVSLRQALAARTLEQLTSDDHLTFVFMEKTLSELHAALTGAVQQCNEECIRKAKELVSDKCRKTESKRRKLQRSQVKEKSCVLGSTTHNNPQHFLKVYQELMLKHQQQSNDLELQQDDRVAEALCDLWRKLHSSWSKKLGELAKEVFLNALPAQSELPVERCEKLWLDLEEELLSQLQQTESTTSRQLEDMRVHLDHDGQVWCEETALVLSCLRHLGEQQMKILQAMVVRQSYSLNSQVGMLIEKKHEHMVVAVQRHFVTRHFCLKVLKEMRLSKLKMLSRADFRALLLEDHSKSQLTPSSSPKAQNKDSTASLAERHLGPESQLVGHSFQQEFLSELETGVELLQSHAQLLLGHTLSYAIWQLMAAKSQTVPQKDQGWKRHLTEVASESVYVTKGSLCALVQSYYSHMQDTTRKLQQDQSNISREEIERQESNNQLNKALLRELANWGRKPTSTEFQQRVEVHKRRVLEQYELEQEVVCEMLRRKKVTQDQAMDRVKEQLVEAEGAFMAELAALARVPLHCPEPEPSSQEDNNTGDESPNVLNLLALNPALDPALNPSLTPTIVTPAVKPMQKRKRERESQLK